MTTREDEMAERATEAALLLRSKGWSEHADAVVALSSEREILREALEECAHWVEWCIHNHDAPDSSLERAALAKALAALRE